MKKLSAVWLFLGLILGLTTLLSAQDDYRYSYMPKIVYENQLFPVTVVGTDDVLSFTFDTTSLTQPISRTPLIVKNGKDTFYTFYFKAHNIKVNIPMLFMTSVSKEYSLPEQYIPIAKLAEDEAFSSVLATRFKLKSQQVSNFDETNHMVTLSLEAYEANIEDMKLHNVKEYGIDNLKREDAKVTAEFYAVLPRDQKELVFSYFDTIKKRFISLTIAVEVANASVTTQSDLHPKVDAFAQLKRYTLIAFSLFFVLMFIWKRDFFYLILAIISIITLLTFYIPHKKICIKQGSPLYIVPTDTSTIGRYIEDEVESMLLGERGSYKKIEYKKGIIGWIKNEDICNH